MLRRPDRLQEEHGAVVVITALLLVVLMGAVAFAVDLARLRHERQVLQTAVDLGALAGAGKLPAQGVAEANAVVAMATADRARERAAAGLGHARHLVPVRGLGPRGQRRSG